MPCDLASALVAHFNARGRAATLGGDFAIIPIEVTLP